ncbi:hypothetical protein ACTFIZ_009012 [Dictyostelium cf. discoideum]
MKFVLLSLFLFNLLLIASSQSYDEFNVQAKGCQAATLNLGECGYFCNKYAEVSQKSSINYALSFFLDSRCTQQGYINGTIPFIMPFSCTSSTNQLGTDGTVKCSSSSTSSSSSSKQIAISTILFSAILLFLINNLL